MSTIDLDLLFGWKKTTCVFVIGNCIDPKSLSLDFHPYLSLIDDMKNFLPLLDHIPKFI
jgi:hypothetical protein